MPATEEFEQIFNHLKSILKAYEPRMVVSVDKEDSYYLNTTVIMKNKSPMFFGGVEIKKNYVNYHLMPVYANPKLLESISPELRARMQGKSCFNFKKFDRKLLDELAVLTEAGCAYFRNNRDSIIPSAR